MKNVLKIIMVILAECSSRIYYIIYTLNPEKYGLECPYEHFGKVTPGGLVFAYLDSIDQSIVSMTNELNDPNLTAAHLPPEDLEGIVLFDEYDEAFLKEELETKIKYCKIIRDTITTLIADCGNYKELGIKKQIELLYRYERVKYYAHIYEGVLTNSWDEEFLSEFLETDYLEDLMILDEYDEAFLKEQYEPIIQNSQIMNYNEILFDEIDEIDYLSPKNRFADITEQLECDKYKAYLVDREADLFMLDLMLLLFNPKVKTSCKVCQGCKKEVITANKNRKYCPECNSEDHINERKDESRKTNYAITYKYLGSVIEPLDEGPEKNELRTIQNEYHLLHNDMKKKFFSQHGKIEGNKKLEEYHKDDREKYGRIVAYVKGKYHAKNDKEKEWDGIDHEGERETP